jgi:succinoglycan biosynthesis protein ExoO
LDYWRRYPDGLDNFVASLARQYSWRAIIVEYVWLHRAIDKLPQKIARLLDTHDIQYRRVEEFASRGLEFPLKITRAEEARIFNRFDAIIAIQSEEAQVIREMSPSLPVLVVGIGDFSGEPAMDQPVSNRLLYVGGYNGANIDGLTRFFEHSWPEILRSCPEANVHVCGFIYRAFPGRTFRNVIFHKYVENLEEQYRQADLVVNPVWIGTGLKIKTVEALARGKPLVTTKTGTMGMQGEIEKACALASDDRDLANEIIRLLSDKVARNRLSRAASAYARTYLGNSLVYKDFLDFLDRPR